jgi:hypothetical protein
MIRLLTAYCNLHTFKTVDAFSGDVMMTRDEGELLLNWLENEIGMKPPKLPEDYCQAIMDVYMGGSPNKWEEDIEKDVKVQQSRARRAARKSLR